MNASRVGSSVVTFSRTVLACALAAVLPVAVLLPVSLPAQQPIYVSTTPPSSATTRHADVLARPVTVTLTKASLTRAIDAVAQSASVRVYYQLELIEAAHRAPITLTLENVPLKDALTRVLGGTNLEVVLTASSALTIRPRSEVYVLAEGVITGKVINGKTKQPVAGVTVLLDDATKGVITAEDGTYRLPASVGEHTVRVRGIGIQRVAQRATVSEGATVALDFQVEASTSVLDEVVVTGSVVATERKAIPTPITVITAADLEKQNITRVEQLFRGQVPGVVALELGTQSYAGALGQSVTSRVYSRGSARLSGEPNPIKTYVDGVELLDPSYLGTIDPKSIEKIEIITGPQAATVYGSGALGGVMQIFTKKGTGHTRPDLTLNLRYGMLQSNLSPSYTPSHDHNVAIAGGSGPEFSYSGTLSYQYTGQWQPDLFARTIGSSLGATHTRGPFTVSGSVALTLGRNGTSGFGYEGLCQTNNSGCYGSVVDKTLYEDGSWEQVNPAALYSQQTSSASSQSLSFSADYRATSIWQHHLTLGRNQTNFVLDPTSPGFTTDYDTLFYSSSSSGRRISAGYNTTLAGRVGALAPTLTFGADGSWGSQMSVSGCKVTKDAASYAGCDPIISDPDDDKHWGGYTNAQLGLFDRVYFTMAIRGEHNPTYGEDHRIDWTPMAGVTYTIEHGDLSLKMLASYGSATRAPAASQRREIINNESWLDPAVYVAQVAAPNLTPEYSRGPQGGIELYYGNIGSITVNRYVQTISSLIQGVPVGDSVFLAFAGCDCGGYWMRPRQSQNVATIRQHGWSSTASVNVGPLSVRGTYSWDDSRVKSAIISALGYGWYQPGQSMEGIPTHTGSMVASYARGGTSVTLATNYVGSRPSRLAFGEAFQVMLRHPRLKMYSIRQTSNFWGYNTQVGYVKSDLSISQRLTRVASLTANVKNLTNNYASDLTVSFPSLGRQTLIGLTLH